MMKIILVMVTLCSLLFGIDVWAASTSAGGIGGIAHQVTTNLSNIARLITAVAYVSGMAFAIAAIAKFKAYKENPTQMALSTPIVFLVIGIALLFLPSVFKAGGQSLFVSGTAGNISGFTKLSGT